MTGYKHKGQARGGAQPLPRARGIPRPSQTGKEQEGWGHACPACAGTRLQPRLTHCVVPHGAGELWACRQGQDEGDGWGCPPRPLAFLLRAYLGFLWGGLWGFDNSSRRGTLRP